MLSTRTPIVAKTIFRCGDLRGARVFGRRDRGALVATQTSRVISIVISHAPTTQTAPVAGAPRSGQDLSRNVSSPVLVRPVTDVASSLPSARGCAPSLSANGGPPSSRHWLLGRVGALPSTAFADDARAGPLLAACTATAPPDCRLPLPCMACTSPLCVVPHYDIFRQEREKTRRQDKKETVCGAVRQAMWRCKTQVGTVAQLRRPLSSLSGSCGSVARP